MKKHKKKLIKIEFNIIIVYIFFTKRLFMSILRSNSLSPISMNPAEERPPSPLSDVDASVQQVAQRTMTPTAEACQAQNVEQQMLGSYAYSILSAPTNIASYAAGFISSVISNISPSGSQAHSQEGAALEAPNARQRMDATTYKNTQLAAHFATLAYKLPEETSSIRYDERIWMVNFLGRTTANGIPAQPAAAMQTTVLGEKITYIAVPGTISVNDWISNSLASLEPLPHSHFINGSDDLAAFFTDGMLDAHLGFLKVALSIVKELRPLSASGFFNSGTEIILTGHSQGAAVATLLAFYISTHRAELSLPPDCKISCITFASPRVFSPKTANYYMSLVPNTYNIANSSDLVPRTPLGTMGYKHVGTKINIPLGLFASAITENVAEDLSRSVHQLDDDAASRLSQALWTVLSPTRWVEGITLCHSMDYYESIISSNDGLEQLQWIPYTPAESHHTPPSSSEEPSPSSSSSSITFKREKAERSEGDEEEFSGQLGIPGVTELSENSSV